MKQGETDEAQPSAQEQDRDLELEILHLRGALAPFAECHDMLEDGSEVELRPAFMGGVVTLPRSAFARAAEVLSRPARCAPGATGTWSRRATDDPSE